MAEFVYKTRGVCAREIAVELDGDRIKSARFKGGCPGNLAAISKVIEGMEISRVIELWRGNQCGGRPTSCVDQLTYALEAAQAAQTPAATA